MQECGAQHPPEEARLLRLAREGNDVASEELFLKYLKGSTSILNFLRRSLRNPEDREEILHDIYLRLVTGQKEFRGEARLSTYIYRIASITLLQKFRRENALKRGRVYRIVSEPVEVVSGRESSPDFHYNLKQVRKLLSDLIHRLPDSYREAMRLRVLEDYSYNEIAAKLDLPLPTVSTKLHKGKKLLAELARRQPDLSPQLLH